MLSMLLIVVGAVFMMWHLQQQQQALYHGMALQGTAIQVESIRQLRQLYSANIVARAQAYGIAIVHDYHDQDRALPLPATLTIELGEALSRERPGAVVRLYSDHPFPWRKATGGAKDAFEAEALRELRRHPDQPFYRFEKYQGRESLRYAVSDRMQANCVTCHNTHPDSPKQDWKEGEVRGVLEFVRPLDNFGADVAQRRANLWWAFGVTVAVLVIGLLGLGLAIRGLRRTSESLAQTEQEVRTLNAGLEQRVKDRTLELHRSQQELADFLENATEGLHQVGADGRVLWVNQAELDLLGYAREECVGHHISEFHADPSAIADMLQRLLKGESLFNHEARLRCKDGTVKHVLISSNTLVENGKTIHTRCFTRDITDRKRAEEGIHSLKEELESRVAERTRQLKESKLATLNMMEDAVRSREKVEQALEDLKREVEERKQLEAQLLRSQRMEAIGSLAGGIAHDLNNALAPILMASEFLKLTNKDAEQGRVLDTIYESAKRGASMVKQILTFARGSEGERGAVQPKHLVKEMIDIARHTFPKAIQIQTDIATNTWTLFGNPTQLHQILLNLCVNARDAMPTGGTLTLTTGNVRLTAADVSLSPDAKPGPYVLLSVTDTGTGMLPEVRARIFDAFFTTKAPGKGTGLGLSTVQNIVKNHGGFLIVDSEMGRGTTFKVYLPALEATGAPAVEATPPALPMGKGELILLVDDEAAIRTIATQTLEMFGYRVVTASDGAQAVGVCAQNLTELQLLITDMAMPVMDGKATIRAIHTILPRLRVIIASGSDSVAGSPALKDLDVQAFLRKPFSAEDLVRIVHEVLHALNGP